MGTSLVIKVICGNDDPERANQGATVAATAASSGVPVSLWLAGEGVWLATPDGGFTLPHGSPLEELIDVVLQAGSVTVCTQCAARRDLTADDLLPGARIAGAAAFVEEALRSDAKVLVY